MEHETCCSCCDYLQVLKDMSLTCHGTCKPQGPTEGRMTAECKGYMSTTHLFSGTCQEPFRRRLRSVHWRLIILHRWDIRRVLLCILSVPHGWLRCLGLFYCTGSLRKSSASCTVRTLLLACMPADHS